MTCHTGKSLHGEAISDSRALFILADKRFQRLISGAREFQIRSKAYILNNQGNVPMVHSGRSWTLSLHHNERLI